MIGLADWNDSLEEDEYDSKSFNEVVEQDDIIEIATRNLKPILCTSSNYDELAHLRVLGENKSAEIRTLYLLLITDVDASKVASTIKVDKKNSREYNVEDRFLGENAIIVSELHIRRVVLKQNGRFCSRCKDYNRDMRLPKNEEYICKSCVLNPYR